ncbi:MAG: MraY family glycosyltransferase [bacterium]|nr:MraY family glycosyltransferase [bacterium]
MNLLFPFLLSTVLGLILTPLTIWLGARFGLVDDPKTHRHPAILHAKPIVRAGGIPLYLGVAIPTLFLLPLDKAVIGILLGGLWVVGIGVLDDKFDIHPYLRFCSNLIAALIVVVSGIGIHFITNPFGGIIYLNHIIWSIDLFGQHTIVVWADLLALLWIPWTMNMLNWSKGVDGQMPGIVIIAAIVLAILSMRTGPVNEEQWRSAFLATTLAGSMLGFLAFNWHPARIFPGYSATFAGFLLAVLAIFSTGKIATAVLVLGIPTIDAIFTVGRRMIQHHNPFFGDRLHLHHLLLDLGWKQEKIALFYWMLCAMLGIAALLLPSLGKFSAAILITLVVGGILLWLHAFLASDEVSGRASG